MQPARKLNPEKPKPVLIRYKKQRDIFSAIDRYLIWIVIACSIALAGVQIYKYYL